VRVPFDTRTIFLSPVTAGQSYDVRVRAVSTKGITGNWREFPGHVVNGKTSPPPAPTRVMVENGFLVADYPDAPVDFWGFRVEYKRGLSMARDGSTSAHPSSTVVQLPFDMSAIPGGTVTFWVTAVDTSGNESTPVRLVRDMDGADIINEIDVVDLKALGFPDSFTGASISGGNLVADGDSVSYLPDDDASYLPVDADSYLPVTYGEMVWLFKFTPAAIDVPSQMSFDTTVQSQGWKIEYYGDDGIPYLPIDGDSYLPTDADIYLPSSTVYGAFPAAITADSVEYSFRVTVYAGSLQGVISKFNLILDVPDEEEEIDNLVIAIGGTRVPITRAYREIRHVAITLQDDGNAADSVRRADLNPTLGPLLQAFNNNVAVPALVDVRVKGIKQT
jgi:hypothetical protein